MMGVITFENIVGIVMITFAIGIVIGAITGTIGAVKCGDVYDAMKYKKAYLKLSESIKGVKANEKI